MQCIIVYLALLLSQITSYPKENEAIATTSMCSRLNDSLTLVKLYQSTNGANWLSPWNLSSPMTTWTGVVLDPNTFCVRQLILNSRNITGTLPKEIGNLANLRTLFLFNNNITGELPSSITNLTELEDLVINDNNFNGDLPSDIGNLRNVKLLSVSNNFFTGFIPTSIGTCNSLVSLDLSTNLIEGTIPKEIGYLNFLQILNLSNNKLSGSVPQDLADLNNLQELYFFNNSLSGTWHKFFNSLTKLRHVWIQNNQFEGSIPDWRKCPLLSLKCEYNNFVNIPDYSTVTTWGSAAPYGLNIIGNRMSFEDLIPLQNIPPRVSYLFRNQQTIQIDSVIFAPVGSTYTIRLNIDDTINNNSYKWFKDTSLYITNRNTFSIVNIKTSDEGYYRGSVSNPAIPGFELKVQLLHLLVTTKPCSDPLGGATCNQARLFCNTAGLHNYCGSLGPIDSTKLNNDPICTPVKRIENPKWFSFISASDSILFEIIPDDCSVVTVNGVEYNGIEASIYKSCEISLANTLYCESTRDNVSFTIGGGGFIQGHQYYLVLDGNRGSICDFLIRVKKGISSFQINDPKKIIGNTIICKDSASHLYYTSPVAEARNYLWTLNDSIIQNNADTSINLQNLKVGSYYLRVKAYNECDTSNPSTIYLEIVPNLQYKNLSTTKVNRDSAYRISLEITSGTPPYQLVGTSGTINQSTGLFMSGLFPCKSNYDILIVDAKGCSIRLKGYESCNCNSYGGMYPTDTLLICEGQVLNAKQSQNPIRDTLDVSTYIIAKSDSNIINNIIKTNKNGNFAFDPSVLRFNTVYYLYYVVGKPNAQNNLNLLHPCTSFSSPQKIIFRPRPIISAGQDNTYCYLEGILSGFGTYKNSIWKLNSGPGNAIIDSITKSTTKVTVDTKGIYSFNFEGSNDYCTHRDEVKLIFKDTLEPNINGIRALCGGNKTKLSIDTHFTSIKWSTGDTLAQIEITQTGRYCVSVTDINGCYGYNCLDIDSIAQPTVAIIGNNQICFGATDSLKTNGIFSKYKWNDSTFTSSLVINSGGDYCVTVTDQYGCTATNCITINQLTEAKKIIEDTACAGDEIFFLGVPYTFPGNYKIVLTNASINQCDSLIYLNLRTDTMLYVKDSMIKHENGINKGSISITVSGGQKPYKYKWNNNATTSSIFNLNQGLYTVTITDANLCTAIFSFVIKNNTSIHDIAIAKSLLLFPNPANTKSKIYIKLLESQLYYPCYIKNLEGKMLTEFTLQFNKTNDIIELPINLSSGIYYFEYLDSKNRRIVEKIVIQ